MGWNPKRYDPPGKPQEPRTGDGCDKCRWEDWETFAWLLVMTVLFWTSIIEVAYGWR